MASDWTIKLRRYLSQHIDQTILFRDIFDHVADDVPIHQASRIWLRRNQALASPLEMRFRAISCFLRISEITMSPKPNGRTFPVTHNTRIIPHGAICLGCGEQFVRQRAKPALGRWTQCCSNACERVVRKRSKAPSPKPALEVAEALSAG